MRKKCAVCAKYFEAKRSAKMCGAAACTKARMQARMRAYRQKPEVKAHERARIRAYRQRPEVKARIRAYRQTPERKAYMRAYRQAPERKAHERARMQTPERKAHMRAYWQAPEVKARSRALRCKYYARRAWQKIKTTIQKEPVIMAKAIEKYHSDRFKKLNEKYKLLSVNELLNRLARHQQETVEGVEALAVAFGNLFAKGCKVYNIKGWSRTTVSFLLDVYDGRAMPELHFLVEKNLTATRLIKDLPKPLQKKIVHQGYLPVVRAPGQAPEKVPLAELSPQDAKTAIEPGKGIRPRNEQDEIAKARQNPTPQPSFVVQDDGIRVSKAGTFITFATMRQILEERGLLRHCPEAAGGAE